MIKEVMEKMKLEKPLLAPDYVWNAYAQPLKSKKQTTQRRTNRFGFVNPPCVWH
jgi:hypothetical protein